MMLPRIDKYLPKDFHIDIKELHVVLHEDVTMASDQAVSLMEELVIHCLDNGGEVSFNINDRWF